MRHETTLCTHRRNDRRSFSRPFSTDRLASLRRRRPLFEPLEERALLALAPLAVDLQAESDSGLYDDDNLTNIAAPTIDITAAEAGDTIRVYREGVLLGEATPIAGTSYQYVFAPGELAEGDNSITARCFDGVDESEDSPPLVITLDVSGPRITASIPETPLDPRADPLKSVTVTFSEAIGFGSAGSGSFAVDDVTIIGPAGEVASTGVDALGDEEYEIRLDPQIRHGNYVVLVDPLIPARHGRNQKGRVQSSGFRGQDFGDTFAPKC